MQRINKIKNTSGYNLTFLLKKTHMTIYEKKEEEKKVLDIIKAFDYIIKRHCYILFVISRSNMHGKND
jgi:hypothetical protein